MPPNHERLLLLLLPLHQQLEGSFKTPINMYQLQI